VALLAATQPPYWPAFRDALSRIGYREGKDVQFDVRLADGNNDLLDKLAADLVRSKPELIVAYQTPAVAAAKKATSVIPIVMAPAGDPVGTGLVASLARPGGNVTGMAANTAEVAGKMLQLIRELKPSARRIAVLANATDAFAKPFLAELQFAAAKLRITLGVALVRGPADYEAVFAEWDRLTVQALIVQPSLARTRAVDLALRYRIPAIAPTTAFAEAGGLMSYSSSLNETADKAASFVDRILRGAKPADLPVEQPTLFELALNLRTAKAIDVEFPDSLIARADALIQ
jgi:putative ABC transport system substrate-binding protein